MVDSVRDERFELIPEDADIPIFVITGEDPHCGLILQQYANRLQQSGDVDAEMFAAIVSHAKYMQEHYNAMQAEIAEAADQIEQIEAEQIDHVEAEEEPDIYFGAGDTGE